MIKVNVAQMIQDLSIDEEDAKIIEKCFKVNRNTTGELLKSKPKIEYSFYSHCGSTYRKSQYISGMAAYVWRMLAFYTEYSQPYSCMPIMADFDLPYSTHEENYKEKRKQLTEHAEFIIDEVLKYIPQSELRGISRWSELV